MSTALRRRFDQSNEDGFTLIELMVVVLIIGILLAIAIPTFLGARNRANDRSAQSNLRNALTAEKTLYTDNEIYTATDAAGITALSQVEPSLTWVGVASSYANRNVSAVAPAAQSVILATQSATGTCWFILDIATPGTPSGTFFAQNKTCTNPAVPTTAVVNPFSNTNVGQWALSF